MKKQNSFKIITAALFSALAVVTSLIIHIPIPGAMGYLNVSDAFSISAVILLGPVYGTLSAVTGGILSDIIAGSPIYIPATLIIKLLTSLAVYVLYKAAVKHKSETISLILPCISAVIIMTSGYLIYEYCFLTGKAAIVGVPFNIMQGILSSAIAVLIIKAMKKTYLFKYTERN